MKSFVCIARFLIVLLFVVFISSCKKDDALELSITDTSNSLSVEQVSLSQLEQHPDLAVLFSNNLKRNLLNTRFSGTIL